MAKKKGPLGKAIGVVAAGLTVAAVVQELAKPADQRTWHGRIAYVPYDFRIPTVDRLLASWWNPEDPRLITPRTFGLGWAVNVGRIVALATKQQS
ncbi:DUF5808 domain-containing protein [Microlunatus ginsengisoli]|uniref:DUF5808 domain-containing protein n=1 Tax=Microlunatus ginsengisoli TaxID=363863 RepID=A0ABP6ZCP2_9ACTN